LRRSTGLPATRSMPMPWRPKGCVWSLVLSTLQVRDKLQDFLSTVPSAA
jgi:hypothetical protein